MSKLCHYYFNKVNKAKNYQSYRTPTVNHFIFINILSTLVKKIGKFWILSAIWHLVNGVVPMLISGFWSLNYSYYLVCSGCYNKISDTGDLINKNVFLTVLEATSPRS